jgi:Flp pilus assembly protein TadG
MNRNFTDIKSRLRADSGAAIVEFVLVLPIFLLLLLGVFDFGKAFNYWIDGTHLSHEGARFAAVGKNPGPGPSLAESIKSRADTAELRDGGTSVTSEMKVCVSFPAGVPAKVGDPVQVNVEFTYTFLGYINAMVPGITSKTVTNTSTMRLERPPTFPEHCTT